MYYCARVNEAPMSILDSIIDEFLNFPLKPVELSQRGLLGKIEKLGSLVPRKEIEAETLDQMPVPDNKKVVGLLPKELRPYFLMYAQVDGITEELQRQAEAAGKNPLAPESDKRRAYERWYEAANAALCLQMILLRSVRAAFPQHVRAYDIWIYKDWQVAVAKEPPPSPKPPFNLSIVVPPQDGVTFW